ncbi:MAG: polyribonucleotide nucleotidyltransferase [bacterium]
MDIERKLFSTDVAGRTLTIEVSKIAEQANAAVIGRYGDTTVLATVVMNNRDEDRDYLPLVVDYEEKFYAVGKMLGSRFMRREGRPSDEAILSGRIIDRVIRPLFDGRIRRGIQVISTVLSFDEENDPDFVALVTASTALLISNIPWNGPASGVRIAKKGDEFIVNPKVSELAGEFEFETFVAGAHGKVNMIELGGKEAAEADVIVAFEKASEEIEKINVFQNNIAAEIGKQKASVTLSEADDTLKKRVYEFVANTIEGALFVKDKTERDERMAHLSQTLKTHLEDTYGYAGKDIGLAIAVFEDVVNDVMHKNVLEKERRVDERKINEVRDLYIETGILPRVHGSGLFMRGKTQSLCVITLAPPEGQQLVETIEFSGKRRFMLHYNFPPFSVGEVRPLRGPGRREIGHGALAEKALRPMLPEKEEFPYTIRIVSEILSSNGSSSMATVCASSIALMDAGVPIKKQVAGIAMGIIIGSDGAYKILTDIQGPEDHYGDMDFKVAGTRDGVNAIQMDVKVEGITISMLREGLEQAREARLHILEKMDSVISMPRKELSPFAPKIICIKIDPSRIGEVIGSGGKVINGIIEETGVITIDIEEDGSVFISAQDIGKAEKARTIIEAITHDFEEGEIVEGSVVKILEFGAIVEFAGGKSGMIHVSELREGFVKNVRDVVKEGDMVRVKILKVENGKTSLSLKQVTED